MSKIQLSSSVVNGSRGHIAHTCEMIGKEYSIVHTCKSVKFAYIACEYYIIIDDRVINVSEIPEIEITNDTMSEFDLNNNLLRLNV